MPWTTGQTLAVLLGALLVIAGLTLIAGRRLRRGGRDDEGAGRAYAVLRWWGTLSTPTRRVVEVSLIVGGYHIAVYALPSHLPMLAVPRDLWWLVPAGIALALGGSLLADRLDRRRG